MRGELLVSARFVGISVGIERARQGRYQHGARVQLYLKAMEGVAQRNPADDEAQLFYAITLNVGASPSDKTYSNQLKGAAILEQIFKRQPRHPGVAHYLIHLYDSPALAEKGIDAAKRYSEIAPAAPHAQHMRTINCAPAADSSAATSANRPGWTATSSASTLPSTSAAQSTPAG